MAVSERGTMYDPGPCSTWRSSSPARPSPTSSTSTRRSRTTSPRSRRRWASRSATSPRDPRPPAPRGSDHRGPRGRRADQVHLRRRRRRGDLAALARGTGIDLLVGIGGTPEGVITACAMKCLAATIQGRLWPSNDEERRRALDAGHDLDRGADHRRPRHRRQRASSSPPASPTASCSRASASASAARRTHSIVMRTKSGTIRKVNATHKWKKLMTYSSLKFD